MRWGDLLRIAVSALGQQKVRTGLSILGVAVGTFSLAVSLSIGQGVQRAVVHQLRRNDQLRKIAVQPGTEVKEKDVPASALEVPGEVEAGKQQRIRAAIVQRWRRTHFQEPKAHLRAEEIAKLAAIEHVISVTPSLAHDASVSLDAHKATVSVTSVAAEDQTIRDRVVAGKMFATNSDRAVLVHEYLLYSWGIRTDDAIRKVLGRKIRLELRLDRNGPPPLLAMLTGGRMSAGSAEAKVFQRVVKAIPAMLDSTEMTDEERRAAKALVERFSVEEKVRPPATATGEFVIAGVIRQWTKDDKEATIGGTWMIREADVLMPAATAQDFFFQDPAIGRYGAPFATLTADREENVRALTATVRELGYTAWSLEQEIDEFRQNAVMITFAFTFIAAVALAVAALGITNTMTMSVLERTREIGVMKAIGARDRHIRRIFLVEGALIGMCGGLLGLFMSWLASFPGDALGRSIMQQQTKAPVEQSLFVFPALVTLGAPALACLITTLAAYYPARRAVHVNTVQSLRHE